MNKMISLLLAMILAVAVSLPAMAGIQGGEVTVTPFAGIYVYDGSQLISPSLALGMRLGYNLNENWGLEGQFTYARLRSEGVYGGVYNATADLLYHFMPEKKVVPYFLVGGGGSRTDYVTATSTNGIVEYGAGIKYYMNDAVALRGDVRQILSLAPNTGTSVGYWQNSQFTVGLSFQFGGRKAVSPAVAPPAAAVKPEPKAVKEEPPPEEPSSWQAENTTPSEGKILVTGMRVNKNEFEIIATEPIRDYKVFTLSQPSRLVVDIANGESGFILKKIVINRLGIATVRFEAYPEYLRMFFDAAQGRMIPYRIEETTTGLKIIVTSPDITP